MNSVDNDGSSEFMPGDFVNVDGKDCVVSPLQDSAISPEAFAMIMLLVRELAASNKRLCDIIERRQNMD